MFVRGGDVYPGAYLERAGYEGLYWSSVSDISNFVYYLDFSPDGVYPSYSFPVRYIGFSVRCVALDG